MMAPRRETYSGGRRRQHVWVMDAEKNRGSNEGNADGTMQEGYSRGNESGRCTPQCVASTQRHGLLPADEMLMHMSPDGRIGRHRPENPLSARSHLSVNTSPTSLVPPFGRSQRSCPNLTPSLCHSVSLQCLSFSSLVSFLRGG